MVRLPKTLPFLPREPPQPDERSARALVDVFGSLGTIPLYFRNGVNPARHQFNCHNGLPARTRKIDRFRLCNTAKREVLKSNEYLQLDLVCSAVLLVVLGLGCARRSKLTASVHGGNSWGHVGRVTTARGVCSTGGLGRYLLGLAEVGGSLDPLDMLDISHPDALSGLVSPEGVGKESDDVSENYKEASSQLDRPPVCGRGDSRNSQLKKANAAIA